MRQAWVGLVAAMATACGTAEQGATPDAGYVPPAKQIYDVSGTVQLHPAELSWRASLAQAPELPAIEGATLNVEDALKALADLPPLKSVAIGAGGSYLVPQVDVTNVSLALVASVKDPQEKLMFSGYGLGKPPFTQALLTNLPVYVETHAFVAQLAQAIGERAADLEESGFILGQIVDKDGHGLAGAKLATADKREVTDDIVYVGADFASKSDGVTSSTGLFVFRPSGGGAKEYTALKDGVSFDKHLSGTRKGTVLSLFLTQTE